jgi:hypothetical protein
MGHWAQVRLLRSRVHRVRLRSDAMRWAVHDAHTQPVRRHYSHGIVVTVSSPDSVRIRFPFRPVRFVHSFIRTSEPRYARTLPDVAGTAWALAERMN